MSKKKGFFFACLISPQNLSLDLDLAASRRPYLEKKKKKTGKSCSQKNPILSTHVEKEDLEAFLTSPGAADEAMSLLDVDGDGR